MGGLEIRTLKMMKVMKHTIWTASCLALSLLLTGCYDSYVKDYDQSAVYVAYQWDLRTFVVGEDQAFKFTVALAGVMQNNQDRPVRVSVVDALVTDDISESVPLEQSGILAMDGLNGRSPVGTLSGDYVGAALAEAGIAACAPLPRTAYRLEGLDGLKIPAGAHTGTVTVRADDSFLSDPDAFVPAYAIGFRIDAAEADLVPPQKSFAVIAVRCENRFYGYYTRAAHVRVLDAEGNVLSETDVAASMVDDLAYTLTTVDAATVRSDKVAGAAGEMLLHFDGSGITLSSPDGSVTGTGSFNGARLLQDRELSLQYVVAAPGGGRTEVSETLYFRNRIRDGVNEWQDEHPEHYQ